MSIGERKAWHRAQETEKEAAGAENPGKGKRKEVFSGRLFMILGLLCLSVSFGLTVKNIAEEQSAEQQASEAIQALSAGYAQTGTRNALGEEDMARLMENAGTYELPNYVLNPEMDMPEEIIDGEAYIGTLAVPQADLTLPVMSSWSYSKLKKAPCRYQGSVYTGDLIIAGHNYRKHFNRLKQLHVWDTLSFTDADGNVFPYYVSAIEYLDGYAVEEMMAGDWDLTLFTCTYGGSVRLTIRCMLEDSVVLGEVDASRKK